MILIFGGAYQGKLEYALNSYGADRSVWQCTDNDIAIDFSKEIINSFHLFVLAAIRNDLDIQSFMLENLNKLQSKIIICEDISSGIVPIDKEMRLWRESVGRSIGMISKHADEVVRVFCGLGAKIK